MCATPPRCRAPAPSAPGAPRRSAPHRRVRRRGPDPARSARWSCPRPSPVRARDAARTPSSGRCAGGDARAAGPRSRRVVVLGRGGVHHRLPPVRRTRVGEPLERVLALEPRIGPPRRPRPTPGPRPPRAGGAPRAPRATRLWRSARRRTARVSPSSASARPTTKRDSSMPAASALRAMRAHSASLAITARWRWRPRVVLIGRSSRAPDGVSGVRVFARCCFADSLITDFPDYLARWVRGFPTVLRDRRTMGRRAGCRTGVGVSGRLAAPSLRCGLGGDPPATIRRSASMATSAAFGPGPNARRLVVSGA